MSIYLCELCDTMKDGDFVGCNEWGSELVCDDCFTDNTPEDWEEYLITYDPTYPQAFKWQVTHNDYDPTPWETGGPVGDHRYFLGPNLADVWQQVIEYNEEQGK